MAALNGLNLGAITENASRLGQRLQETLSERTRDLSLGASGSSYLDTTDDKLKNIRQQLDSSSDREKLEAMKRLIALISKGRNVSEFFAQVVKNVASHNLEIRKLVYIYLLRYAEQEPDLALLSINTFQKDLTDSNPLIRAMALRVLSGIGVPMIGSIVVLAIKKCAADTSPYVRKAAALAIPRCYSLDQNHLPDLIGILSSLLRDRSPLSIGSVAVAFESTCPTRLDLLHPHYRRLCRTLIDVDEWGQVALIDLLTRYVRVMLPKPSVTQKPNGDSEEEVDKDLHLLLTCSEPLLQSQNPAVVLAVIKAFYYLGPPSSLPKIVSPLLRLLVSSKEIERVILAYITMIACQHQDLFRPHYNRFFVLSDDFSVVKSLKVRLLLNLVTPENHQALLREFIDYAEDTDDQLVRDSIHAVGSCARIVLSCTQQCLNILMGLIRSKHDVVVSNAVVVLKSLVQSQTDPTGTASTPLDTPVSIVSKLAYRIDEIRHPQARACVVWLVGEYAPAVPTGQQNGVGIHDESLSGAAPWAPDVLRRTAKTFGDEQSAVKLAIVALAAKLLCLCPSNPRLVLLARYVFSLARYDANYDVRDRARMLSALLTGVSPSLNGQGEEWDDEKEDRAAVILRREQVRLVLFEGKRKVVEQESWKEESNAMLGSLEAITGKGHGDRVLPDWLEEGAEPSLRDTEDDRPPAAAFVPTALGSGPRSIAASNLPTPIVLTPTASGTPVTSSKGAFTDLDKFYADADEESEESESESEDEDGEGGQDEEGHASEGDSEEDTEEDSDDASSTDEKR